MAILVKLIVGVLALAMCVSSALGQCRRESGCPVGKRNGDEWMEKCDKCSCGNLIETQIYCYLPAVPGAEGANPIPIYNAPYKSAGPPENFQCPPGFMGATMADYPYIKAQMMIIFNARIGGDVGCCSTSSTLFINKQYCRVITLDDGCTKKAVLKNDKDTPCPGQYLLGAIGR